MKIKQELYEHYLIRFNSFDCINNTKICLLGLEKPNNSANDNFQRIDLSLVQKIY